MAAAGTPMRTLQHWMGHADFKTTQVYAHYQPSEDEADAMDRAFGSALRLGADVRWLCELATRAIPFRTRDDGRVGVRARQGRACGPRFARR